MRSKAILKSINKAKFTFFSESDTFLLKLNEEQFHKNDLFLNHVANKQKDNYDQNEKISDRIIFDQII